MIKDLTIEYRTNPTGLDTLPQRRSIPCRLHMRFRSPAEGGWSGTAGESPQSRAS